MLVKQMLDEWLIYYRDMQVKDNQKQNIMVQADEDDDVVWILKSFEETEDSIF